MKPSNNFDAFWLPSFDSEADPDEVIAIGFDWLRTAEKQARVEGVLAMHASSMRHNRPILASAPWEIVSPRSRGAYRTAGPVLAIYPPPKTLELAERMARGAALCVIPYVMSDVLAWIQRTGAKGLVSEIAAPELPSLPADVQKELRHVVSFGGHNGFLGGGAKEIAIRAFHRIRNRPGAPSPEELADYLRITGEVDADGVARAGRWYTEVLHGKRHRDYRGRVIS